MSVTVPQYRARIGRAHANVESDLIEVCLAEAEGQMDASAWGTQYTVGAIMLAAHLVEKTPGSGANNQTAAEVGAVVSESADRTKGDGSGSRLSRSYATPRARTPEEDELSTTAYGRRYLAMRSALAVGPTLYTTGC